MAKRVGEEEREGIRKVKRVREAGKVALRKYNGFKENEADEEE